jgi:hypothetical protein
MWSSAIVVQRSQNGRKTQKCPRLQLAGNCYHPRDKGFPVRVRFVSGRLHNRLICKRYTVSTLWSIRIQDSGEVMAR